MASKERLIGIDNIIGHEKDRHARRENWMKTKVGFYEVAKNSYGNFDFKDCISRIMSFVRGGV